MEGKRDIIRVEHLVAKYDEKTILDDITFSVQRGEILSILGTSGCGKSTLLRHMVGLDRPYSGRVFIDEVDITSCGQNDFYNSIRKIGILFQSSALFGSMTIAENVALPIIEFTDLPRASIDNLVRLKLCMVGLGGFESHLPSEISGGMKKRAGLARALSLNPKILFLDEPTAGLDPITAAEIDELILNLNGAIGTTMVIVTHELQSIFRVAKRVIILDKQKKGIIAQGNPEFLRDNSENPFVRQFFNRQAKPVVMEKLSNT